MKKQLLFLCTILAFTASFAAHIPPVRTLEIPQATFPFAIDGIDDEDDWSAEQSTDAFNPTGNTGADPDFTFTFKVAYDFNYLYVFGKILDDYDNSWDWGGSDQWLFDNVEVFVDLDTNGSGNAPAYDSNTYQLRINRGIDSIGNNYGRDCLRSDHRYYWENTADGWLFEAALTWKFVLGPGQKTEDILTYCDGVVQSGFDMSSADSDTDGAGAHDCQVAWDNDEPQDAADRTEDNAWNDRTVFGVVTFEYSWNCCDDVKIIQGSDSFQLYPNPATNLLSIENNANYASYDICNMLGQVVLSSEFISGKNEINISGLPKANIYFLRIKDANGEFLVAKFVKE